MGSELNTSTRLLPPPGPKIRRPVPSDPYPPCNPPLFNDAMSVRTTVFIDEQGCSPESELDEDDQRSYHWVMYDTQADKQEPIGVIRLVPPPHPPHEVHLSNGGPNHSKSGSEGHAQHEEPCVKLTRVAVLPAYRGLGLSRKLVDTTLNWAAGHKEDISSALGPKESWNGLVLVHAQVQVEALYARMGFVTDESMGKWEEEGILHVGMWKRIELTTTSH
ncbi:acetyltransferase [Coccidioides immitis RS]|uniref:Glucosamine 6-phosphate N-acetyltransferase n=3 Tax=Coccidioides immitis TaxID=5501 RepID=J3K7G1_COCIM|nr:acetyltransferase [Coccidioides immitis RS]EAS30633.3 acetyltransferase [Coccidioides immitis RS]KMP03189.1 hypothetical protein CIRG_02881 [Coccidioides immitis RMSCC 2394]KMU84765.1 hypothetical protein CIHG_02548 [Coccidioides immitis H538.4]TPX23560.1 hypothetical protein DIZ76_012894 [Coccidioides immitis]